MKKLASVLAGLLLGSCAGHAYAASFTYSQLSPRGAVQSSDYLGDQPVGYLGTQYIRASDLQTYVAGNFSFSAYPWTITAPDGSFLWGTQSPIGVAPATQYGPYESITAVGSLTINATKHNDPVNCTNETTLYCGGETAFGAETLRLDVTGHDNTAVGDTALTNLSSGNNDTFVGSSAGSNITTATSSTGLGASACQNILTTLGPVTCIGVSSLMNGATNSEYADGIGFDSFFTAATVQFSAALGDAAGYSATSATYSTVLGVDACHNVTSFSGSICIGAFAGPSTGLTNTLWVGGVNNATPLLYGGLTGSTGLGVNTSTLVSGAALTLGGGGLALPTGTAAQWNSDTGISRTAAGALAVGNGTAGDTSGALNAAQFSLQGNANLTQISMGQAQLGTAQTPGHGGSLSLTNLVSYGVIRPGTTVYGSLSTVDPSPQVGDYITITDASACTANTAVTAGGGSTHSCPTVYNGAGWIALVTH